MSHDCFTDIQRVSWGMAHRFPLPLLREVVIGVSAFELIPHKWVQRTIGRAEYNSRGRNPLLSTGLPVSGVLWLVFVIWR